MHEKLSEHLKNLQILVDELLSTPANEQHLGNMQKLISASLLAIKQCLEVIAWPDNCPR